MCRPEFGTRSSFCFFYPALPCGLSYSMPSALLLYGRSAHGMLKERQKKRLSGQSYFESDGTAPGFDCQKIQMCRPPNSGLDHHFVCLPGTPVPGFLIPCLRHCFYIRRSARGILRKKNHLGVQSYLSPARDGTYPKASFTSNSMPAFRNIVSNSFS